MQCLSDSNLLVGSEIAVTRKDVPVAGGSFGGNSEDWVPGG